MTTYKWEREERGRVTYLLIPSQSSRIWIEFMSLEELNRGGRGDETSERGRNFGMLDLHYDTSDTRSFS